MSPLQTHSILLLLYYYSIFDITPIIKLAGTTIIRIQAIKNNINSTTENIPFNNANVYVSLKSLMLVT